MWRNLIYMKFIHRWSDFTFLHMTDLEKSQISPHLAYVWFPHFCVDKNWTKNCVSGETWQPSGMFFTYLYTAQVALRSWKNVESWFTRLFILGLDFIQIFQMFLPPPSYDELFPKWNVQGEKKTIEEISRGTRKVNFVPCDEVKDEQILPLQQDPCRSFFSRVAKWDGEVRLKKKAV